MLNPALTKLLCLYKTILGVALLFCAGMLMAQDQSKLYIVNSSSQNISVIDTKADEIVDTISLPTPAYQIAFSPDNILAYITTFPGKAENKHLPPQLLCIDTATGKIKNSIPCPINPLASVHISPDGNQAYVVTAGATGMRNTQRGQVLFIDLSSGKIANTLFIGLNPLASAMTPDGKKLYTADWGSHSISIIDLPAARLKDMLPLGMATSRTLAMSPDGKKLYAFLERQSLPVASVNRSNNSNISPQQQQEKLFYEIDTHNDAVAKFTLEGFGPVYALAISPDGKSLYAYARAIELRPNIMTRNSQGTQQQMQIAPSAQYSLMRIDLNEKKIAKRFGDFGFIAGLSISSDGNKIYLIGTPGNPAHETTANTKYQNANSPQQVDQALGELMQLQKSVTILDAKTGKVIKVLPVGSLPQGAAQQNFNLQK